MKVKIPFLLLLFVWSCKMTSSNSFRLADEPLRIKSTRELKQVLIDSVSEFKVKNEGKEMIDLDNQRMLVGSDLAMNGDSLLSIRFAKASLNQDTLEITIFELNESSDNFYKIKIVGDLYKAKYDFSTPVDQKNREIKTIQTELVLNTSEYDRGKVIRGHTEFRGKCTSECEWKNGLITLNGNFVAKIE